MNKYVAQLLEVIQKKTGCDTSGAVRWLANQAGVSERTAWVRLPGCAGGMFFRSRLGSE